MSRGPIVTFESFSLDKHSGKLSENEVILPIDQQSLQLLIILIENQNKIVSKERIYATIWGKGIRAHKNAVPNLVSKLRHVLRDSVKEQRYILTHRHNGYQFNPDIDLKETDRPRASSLIALPNRLRLTEHINRGDLVNEAKEIDMLGVRLYRLWFGDGSFLNTLSIRLESGQLESLRVLLPERTSPCMKALIRNKKTFTRKNMAEDKANDYLDGYDRSVRYVRSLEKKSKKTLLGLLKDQVVSCGVVRLDRLMILTLYTHYTLPIQGSHAVLVIRKREKPSTKNEKAAAEMFDKFKTVFDVLWEKAHGKPKPRKGRAQKE